MTEQRWGEEWHPGMRVKVFNRYETPGQVRTGTIRERSWGRDKGKPIWRFVVDLDGIEGGWVFEPSQLQPETEPE